MTATLLCGSRSLDDATLTDRALRGANALAERGIGEGSVVAIMLRNDIAFFEAVLMTRFAGCYPCPVNWHFKATEAGHVLRDSGASVLVIHADLLAQVADVVPDDLIVLVVDPSESVRAAFGLGDATFAQPSGSIGWEGVIDSSTPYVGPPRTPRFYLFYSSGTTGRPKGIRRAVATPEQAAGSAEIYRRVFATGPGMRTAAATPLYHGASAGHGLQSVLTGDLVVIYPRFDPEQLLADIERYRLTALNLVPTLFLRLLRLSDDVKRRHDLSSLRHVAITGSPCASEVKRAMIDWWGPVINETYASTDAGYITFCSSQESLQRPGTAGRPLPSATVRILDDNGVQLPAGEVGLVYCRQALLPDFTYINQDEARRSIEHDGLFCIGDMGAEAR